MWWGFIFLEIEFFPVVAEIGHAREDEVGACSEQLVVGQRARVDSDGEDAGSMA